MKNYSVNKKEAAKDLSVNESSSRLIRFDFEECLLRLNAKAKFFNSAVIELK